MTNPNEQEACDEIAERVAAEYYATRQNDQITPQLYTTCPYRPGLTKREYFAALAMQGFAALPMKTPKLEACDMAVKWAAALIEALNKPKP